MNTEGTSIKQNGYLCGRKTPVETISVSPLTSFEDTSWEAATPTVLSLAAESQIVFNIIGTLQLSISNMDGLPTQPPNPMLAQ